MRNRGSRLVIGPWPHGGRWYSSPLVRGRRATDFDHVAELVRFFDRHLRDADHAFSTEDPVHYFTMGEERWKSARAWPPPEARPLVFYPGPGGELRPTQPDRNEADRYIVDFKAGTGVHSRFGKHLAGGRYPVGYPDRARRDRQLLVYTSAPLAEDTEVTGHPRACLQVSSTATDGAIIVYLEEVAPDGTVRVITDGALRLVTRQASPGGWPYWAADLYRPFRRADVVPVTPGEVVDLTFDLFPVSWLFRAGHALRLALAGADADNFLAIAEDQAPTVCVHHGPGFPSRLELPAMPRRDG